MKAGGDGRAEMEYKCSPYLAERFRCLRMHLVIWHFH